MIIAVVLLLMIAVFTICVFRNRKKGKDTTRPYTSCFDRATQDAAGKEIGSIPFFLYTAFHSLNINLSVIFFLFKQLDFATVTQSTVPSISKFFDLATFTETNRLNTNMYKSE